MTELCIALKITMSVVIDWDMDRVGSFTNTIQAARRRIMLCMPKKTVSVTEVNMFNPWTIRTVQIMGDQSGVDVTASLPNVSNMPVAALKFINL